MDTDSEELFYLGAGPLVAVLLGVALVPIRELTTASNFTYLFLALIIVVAEFGGRRAAIASAVASTLSLDFFLTQPYLRLEIQGKHDIIAFFGLAGCGLLAAALASPRRPRSQRGTGEGNLRPGP
jgi:K+-sensing histidine kinase KdpD